MGVAWYAKGGALSQFAHSWMIVSGLCSTNSIKTYMTNRPLKFTQILKHAFATSAVCMCKDFKFTRGWGPTHAAAQLSPCHQAFRDNDRFAIQSTELAGHLWKATGLSEVMKKARIGDMHAVGLNPNLRLYRYDHEFIVTTRCLCF